LFRTIKSLTLLATVCLSILIVSNDLLLQETVQDNKLHGKNCYEPQLFENSGYHEFPLQPLSTPPSLLPPKMGMSGITGDVELTPIGNWGIGELSSPNDIAVNSSGYLYIADTGNHQIKVYSPDDGTLVNSWGGQGTGNYLFQSPYGITINGSDFIHVADTNNGEIKVYNPAGVFVNSWGSINEPLDMAITTSGDIYVAAYGEFTVKHYFANGTFIRNVNVFGQPCSITFDPTENVIRVLSSDSRVTTVATANDETIGTSLVSLASSSINRRKKIFTDQSIGTTFISDPTNDEIVVLDNSGGLQHIRTWGSGPGAGADQFNFPEGIDTNGTHVFVADNSNNRVQIFDTKGNLVQTLGTGTAGSGNDQFNWPTGIAIDKFGSNDIYVVDYNNHRVQVFDESGTYLRTIGTGSAGSGNGEFNNPLDAVVAPSGDVYVVDQTNDRVQIFNSSGDYVGQWGGFSQPEFIDMNSTGFIYVSDYTANNIRIFNGTGTLVGQWGSSGAGPGQFNGAIGLSIDESDNVYVADHANYRVQVFNSSGGFITSWGSQGSGVGQFDAPYGVVVNSTGYIYVTDHDNNHRLLVFGYDGLETQSTFGSPGSATGQFNNPAGMAVSTNGSILYIIDTGNNRISLYYISPYTSHGPILINGNVQFSTTATSEGWAGNGTTGNPYIIENYNITDSSSNLIEILNTNVSFIIRNCFLDCVNGINHGIYLQGTENAVVLNNDIQSASTGILMQTSSNFNDITGNSLSNCINYGIRLETSSNNTLSGNYFVESTKGLSLDNSENNTIQDNYCFNSGNDGLDITNSSTNNIISNNTIAGSGNNGIYMNGASFTSLAGNNISFNSDNGISMMESDNCIINSNTMTNNTALGIVIFSTSDNNNVTWNALKGNNAGSIQATDGGINNFFCYNHFDDWLTPDTNGDFFVDNPYVLGGTAGNEDLFPRIMSVAYSIHDPINIIGNAQFDSVAATEGWTGQGTLLDPYMIEALYINRTPASSPDLISIQSTSYYFHIQSYFLVGRNKAIALSGSDNAVIDSNTIHNSFATSIEIVNSDNITLSNNHIQNVPNSRGIVLSTVTDSIIRENTVEETYSEGIYLNSCDNITITGNTVSGVTGSGNGAIEISSSSYLVVDNNTVFSNANSDGIAFYVVSNCSVNGNYLQGNRNGFYINQNCLDNNFTANTVASSTEIGFYLRDNSHNNTIRGNNFANNGYHGMLVDLGCKQNFIENNIIYGNTQDGIRLQYSCENNSFESNTIYNNEFRGIEVYSCLYNVFVNNTVYDHRNPGNEAFPYGQAFYIDDSADWNVIVNNTIYHNIREGLFIWNSDNNLIYWNSFFDNNDYGPIQATESVDLAPHTPNNISYNYWNDHVSPDSNEDGIVDTSYTIGGNSSNADLYPLVSPLHFTLHVVTAPLISYPVDGIIAEGTVIITWSEAIDTLGHSITYDVSYSSDHGLSWTPIVTGITGNSTPWDTTTVSDGSTYWIRVIANCTEGYYGIDMTSDFSVANLAITAPEITYPTGGSVLSGTVNVTWTEAIDPQGHTVTYSIYFHPNSGVSGTWTEVVTGITGNTYSWDTTNHPNTNSGILRINATSDNGESYDDSEQFTIDNRVIDLVINSPNGGETLSGSAIINWTVNDTSSTWDYRIDFSYDNGNNWQEIGTTSSAAITPQFIWNTTASEDGRNCLIRVVITTTGVRGIDTSDAVFTVDNDPTSEYIPPGSFTFPVSPGVTVSFDVSGNTEVTIKQLSTGPSTGASIDPLGIYLDIEMSNTSALDELWINISFSELAGRDPANVSIYYYDASLGWIEAEETGVDYINEIVWAKVTHLTLFGVMEKKAVAPSDPGTLVVLLLVLVGGGGVGVFVIYKFAKKNQQQPKKKSNTKKPVDRRKIKRKKRVLK